MTVFSTHSIKSFGYQLKATQQTIDDIAQLNEEHWMLICCDYRAVVRPGAGIESHFRHEHQIIGQTLKDIKDYYSTMDLADLKLSQLPADGSAAIELLDVLYGYSCAACRYLITARDNITCHWREIGYKAAENRWTEVRLQTWMRRKYAWYWII